MRKRIVIYALILFAIVATIVTVYLVQQRQDVRQRASTVASVSLAITPSQRAVAINESFPITISTNTNGQDVGSINIAFTYEQGLEYVSFTPTSPLIKINAQEHNATTRTVRIVLVNATKTQVLGANKTLGTLTMKGKTTGTWTVRPQVGVKVTASGVNTYVPVQNEASLAGTYTVGTTTLSPNPSPPVNCDVDTGRETGCACESNINCGSNYCHPEFDICAQGPSIPPNPSITSVVSPTGGQGGTNPSATPTAIPTNSPSATVTSSPTPTATNTPIPTVTNTPAPTPYPTATLFPTPSIAPDATTVQLDLRLPGIGSNVAQAGQGTLNNNEDPLRKSREVEIELRSSNGSNVTTLASETSEPVTGVVIFDPATFSYKGEVDLHNLPTGNYIILVRMDNTLYSQLPGFPTITESQNTALQQITLIPGDLDRTAGSDDEMDLADWNLFKACYDNAPACADNTDRIHADFRDDGTIDDLEFNIILRGFQSRTGASKN